VTFWGVRKFSKVLESSRKISKVSLLNARRCESELSDALSLGENCLLQMETNQNKISWLKFVNHERDKGFSKRDETETRSCASRETENETRREIKLFSLSLSLSPQLQWAPLIVITVSVIIRLMLSVLQRPGHLSQTSRLCSL
jgi:hypothetical protein